MTTSPSTSPTSPPAAHCQVFGIRRLWLQRQNQSPMLRWAAPGGTKSFATVNVYDPTRPRIGLHQLVRDRHPADVTELPADTQARQGRRRPAKGRARSQRLWHLRLGRRLLPATSRALPLHFHGARAVSGAHRRGARRRTTRPDRLRSASTIARASFTATYGR